MKRILIVDDEKSVTIALQEGFQRYRKEFKTDIAFCAEDAFKLLEKYQYIVVVSDIRLPQKSGLDVLLKLSEEQPEAIFIAITAFSTPAVKQEVLKNGGLEYLEKPFEFHQIENLVLKYIRKTAKSGGSNGDFLQSLGLSSVAQLINMEEKTLVLEVSAADSAKGFLAFKRGELVDAAFQKLQGEKAAITMFSLRGLKLTANSRKGPRKKTVHAPLMNLLMHAMKELDEKGREKEIGKKKQSDEISSIIKGKFLEEMENFRTIKGFLNSAIFNDKGHCILEAAPSSTVSMGKSGKSLSVFIKETVNSMKQGGLGSVGLIQTNSDRGILLSKAISVQKNPLYLSVYLSSDVNLAMARRNLEKLSAVMKEF